MANKKFIILSVSVILQLISDMHVFMMGSVASLGNYGHDFKPITALNIS